MSESKILFICKNRDVTYSGTHYGDDVDYSEAYCDKKSSGLVNSVKFVVDMLQKAGVNCKMVDVIDNNSIDREVNLFKPTHVVIEALWVVPEKFAVLTRLHPKVKWIIRLHSELPFIAGEGMAIDWIYEYKKYKNITIACNSERIAKSLSCLTKTEILYLPNYYDVNSVHTRSVNPITKKKGTIDIGCFGAIRPLKNQFIQAVSSIIFANVIGKKLRFHINGSRVEGKGDSHLRNIRNLFAHNPSKHELVEHDWMSHDVFAALQSQMDVITQVSFTETYNIVTADAIAQDVPVVTSDEIKFVLPIFQAKCTSTVSITFKLILAYYLDKIGFSKLNKLLLKFNSKQSKKQWLKIFK